MDRQIDEFSMAICAIRYTIGRRSYIVSDGVRWARHFGNESPWVRSVITRDLQEAVERDDNGLPSLGMAMDAQAWRVVLAELLASEHSSAMESTSIVSESLPEKFSLAIEHHPGSRWEWKVTCPLYPGLSVVHENLVIALTEVPKALSMLIKLDESRQGNR